MTEPDYQRTCPTCGQVNEGEPYDIGDGPEFSCVNCEWCWGALGQSLTDSWMTRVEWPVTHRLTIDPGLPPSE